MILMNYDGDEATGCKSDNHYCYIMLEVIKLLSSDGK